MDDFNGDNAKLVECINALLSMDEAGALRPHGVGGHGRKLLEAAASRLQALSHAAGQEVDSRDETLRVFREMAGKVHGMFFWRVSPDSKGNHSISHEAVQAVVDLCQEIEQGTPAYENLTPAVASSEAAPPTTSAEVGQDGEQCRAASVDSGRLASKLEDVRDGIADVLPIVYLETIDDAIEALRALSRGVPEGFPGELDTLRAFAVEQHEAFDRYCAAIAAQRKQAPEKAGRDPLSPDGVVYDAFSPLR